MYSRRSKDKHWSIQKPEHTFGRLQSRIAPRAGRPHPGGAQPGGSWRGRYLGFDFQITWTIVLDVFNNDGFTKFLRRRTKPRKKSGGRSKPLVVPSCAKKIDTFSSKNSMSIKMIATNQLFPKEPVDSKKWTYHWGVAGRRKAAGRSGAGRAAKSGSAASRVPRR